ncbi:MAG: hypothetical protein K2I96_19790 [Lachnospiraceae bacterium]|nr:hypothetical protein [Lachnospiraceae bacterium]
MNVVHLAHHGSLTVDKLLQFPELLVKLAAGCWDIWLRVFRRPNDGLLAPRAAMWTNFRGVVTSSSDRGISHCDEVDLRRRGF